MTERVRIGGLQIAHVLADLVSAEILPPLGIAPAAFWQGVAELLAELTLMAADKMDREGNKAAKDLIAAAKIVVPSMAARVADRAIQVHGAKGVSQDTFLAKAYTYARFIRIGDGPDQVHLSALAKHLLKLHGGEVRS